MDRHFARGGPEGRTMMCSTASVQVCLDAGADDAEVAERWHALHAWLPVLTALFANSPAPGWRCARTAVWAAIDPTRTAAPAGTDPRSAYGRWALDAQLLAVRREAGSWSAPAGLTFRDWLRGGGPGLAAPTWADLDYHLTTLFPPVRARGHLELRAVDAQPGDGWRVVVALVAALLDDPAARAAATAAATEAAEALGAGRRRVAQSRDAGGRAGRDDRPGPAAGRDDVRGDGGRCVDPRRPAGAGSRGGGIRRAVPRSPPVPRRRPCDRPCDRTRGERMTDLRQRIADDLARARRRSESLTVDVLDDAELTAQHSPIMSPLVWDFAHVGNQEELWLVRDAGGREPVRADIDELYDAFKHPRKDRPALPLLDPRQSAAYIREVRQKALDVLGEVPMEGRRLTDGGFVFGMIVQHEQQHVETMLATHQLRAGAAVLDAPAAATVHGGPVDAAGHRAGAGRPVRDGHQHRAVGAGQRAAGAPGRPAGVPDRHVPGVQRRLRGVRRGRRLRRPALVDGGGLGPPAAGRA